MNDRLPTGYIKQQVLDAECAGYDRIQSVCITLSRLMHRTLMQAEILHVEMRRLHCAMTLFSSSSKFRCNLGSADSRQGVVLQFGGSVKNKMLRNTHRRDDSSGDKTNQR